LFEILFLGTSASAPSAKRGLPALIVKHDEYRFLVDCGEGTQRQILQSGVGFRHLTRVLLTHGHLDHILGLGGLLSTFLRWEAIEELEIFGGRSTLDRVHDLLYGVVLRGNLPPMPLQFREIKAGTFLDAADFPLRTAGRIAWATRSRGRRDARSCQRRQINWACRSDRSAGNLWKARR
jgi:ribonuclease Z